MNALYEIAKSSLDSETQIIHPEIITEPNIHYQAVRFHKIGWNASFGPVTMLTGLDTLAVLSVS